MKHFLLLLARLFAVMARLKMESSKLRNSRSSDAPLKKTAEENNLLFCDGLFNHSLSISQTFQTGERALKKTKTLEADKNVNYKRPEFHGDFGSIQALARNMFEGYFYIK